jgi:predicted RNA-binding Zn ribbon-like protein
MSDWVWDGGRSSLDLLNTVRDRSRRARETLRNPGDLAAWLREASLLGDASDPGEDDLNAARRLRAAIDTLTFPPGHDGAGPPAGKRAEAAVAVVNAAAAHAPLGPRLALSPDGRAYVVPPRPSVAAALGRIALDAIELLGGDDQLRVCAADDCGIRFVDRSPSGNRQWCSMRRCGNRLKARRHYARIGSADRG